MNEKEKAVHRMFGRRINAESELWCLAQFCLHLIISLHFKMLPNRVDPLCLCKIKSEATLWLISFQWFPILLKVKYKVLKMSYSFNITRSSPIRLESLLLSEQARHLPASGPLYLLFPLSVMPTTPPPPAPDMPVAHSLLVLHLNIQLSVAFHD